MSEILDERLQFYGIDGPLVAGGPWITNTQDNDSICLWTTRYGEPGPAAREVNTI